jgi:hypothetical protein
MNYLSVCRGFVGRQIPGAGGDAGRPSEPQELGPCVLSAELAFERTVLGVLLQSPALNFRQCIIVHDAPLCRQKFALTVLPRSSLHPKNL